MIAIYKAANGQYFYVVKGRNGQTLVHSETLKQKRSVLKSITALLNAVEGLGINLITRDATGGDFPQFNKLRAK